jgi:hypothetical protein
MTKRRLDTTPETFTMHTQELVHPQFVQGGIAQIPTNVIVAIDSPETAYREQRRYTHLTSDVREWEFTLPSFAAQRFSRLYDWTMVRQNVGAYECHSLPPYIYAEESTLCLSPRFTHKRDFGEPVRPCDLEEGRPYGTISRRGANVHTMLGMGDAYPKHNVSILGGDGPLTVTNTVTACEAFGGQLIVPILFERDLAPVA